MQLGLGLCVLLLYVHAPRSVFYMAVAVFVFEVMMQRLLSVVCDKTEAVGVCVTGLCFSLPSDDSAHAQSSHIS